MRSLILGLLSAICLFAEVLPSAFVISEDSITSKDVKSDAPLFLIARFGNRFVLELPAKNLIDQFAKAGIKVEFTQERVRFEYRSKLDFQIPKKQIQDFFQSHYAPVSLQVQEVALKPLVPLPQGVKWKSAELENTMLKRQNFHLLLKDEEGREYLFLCEVKGEMQVIQSSKNIRAGERLSPQNTKRQKIAFDPDYFQAISSVQGVEARSYIRQNEVIVKSKIKPQIIIKKGDLLEVRLQEEGIIIEGTFEAMSSGAMGEEIWVRHPQSKKNIKVKIMSSKKAEAL